MNDPRRTAIAIIIAHLIVSIVHGASHAGAGVGLGLLGQLYVLVVITIAPLVAGFLLYRGSLSIGGWLMMLSMFGALIFGVVNHFLIAGADNVMQVQGPMHSVFMSSAIAIAVIELIGTPYGWRILQLAAQSGS